MRGTSGTPDADYTAIYVPRDATTDDWSERFMLRVLVSKTDPESVAEDVVNRVNALKAGDRFATATAYSYGVDGSAAVEFRYSDGKDLVEHEVHRYFRSGDRLVSFQYARRFRFSKGGAVGAETFFAETESRTNRILAELDRPDLPMRPAATSEEKLIRAAAIRKLAAFENDKEPRRAVIRKDFQEKRITAGEALSRLKAIDAETAPADDTLLALKPVPIKPKPPATRDAVKPEQRERL